MEKIQLNITGNFMKKIYCKDDVDDEIHVQ